MKDDTNIAFRDTRRAQMISSDDGDKISIRYRILRNRLRLLACFNNICLRDGLLLLLFRRYGENVARGIARSIPARQQAVILLDGKPERYLSINIKWPSQQRIMSRGTS